MALVALSEICTKDMCRELSDEVKKLIIKGNVYI